MDWWQLAVLIFFILIGIGKVCDHLQRISNLMESLNSHVFDIREHERHKRFNS